MVELALETSLFTQLTLCYVRPVCNRHTDQLLSFIFDNGYNDFEMAFVVIYPFKCEIKLISLWLFNFCVLKFCNHCKFIREWKQSMETHTAYPTVNEWCLKFRHGKKETRCIENYCIDGKRHVQKTC